MIARMSRPNPNHVIWLLENRQMLITLRTGRLAQTGWSIGSTSLTPRHGENKSGSVPGPGSSRPSCTCSNHELQYDGLLFSLPLSGEKGIVALVLSYCSCDRCLCLCFLYSEMRTVTCKETTAETWSLLSGARWLCSTR